MRRANTWQQAVTRSNLTHQERRKKDQPQHAIYAHDQVEFSRQTSGLMKRQSWQSQLKPSAPPLEKT